MPNSPTPEVSTRPPPRKPPGPEPKPMTQPGYEPPRPAITHIKRTYTRARKLEVLSYIENHRIPLRDDRSDLGGNKVLGDSPVEEGFRRPYLREAAAYFGIRSWGTVQTWWSKRHQIWQGRRAGPRYRPRWPELERRLYSEFCTARENRRLVQRSWFRRRATAIFADVCPGDVFVFSNGWFRAFLRRHQITHRRITHASTRIPEEIIECTNEFLQFIRRNSRMESWMNVTLMSDPVGGLSLQRFPPHLIANLDETPMPFEFLDGFTFDHKGTQSVQGRSERSGWAKRQATLVLTLLGDGSGDSEHLKPVIIFHGKGTVLSRESGLYHSGVEVKFNETAYNNEDLFVEWIETRLAAYTEGRECLLVIDVATFHKTPRVQAVLKDKNITPALIPPGLTSYLQPLDVGFNGPFKKWLREETDLYLDRLETTPEKWTLRDRRIMTTHVVANAWRRAFTPENRSMVAKLFKRTGISIHPDGREDHLVNIKGIPNDKLQIEEHYRPPDLRTNNDLSGASASLNSANGEFISTAEAPEVQHQAYSTLTVKVLKEMCRQRGLYVTGCKRILIERLEGHDIAVATRVDERLDRQSDQVMAGHDGIQVVQPEAADLVQHRIPPGPVLSPRRRLDLTMIRRIQSLAERNNLGLQMKRPIDLGRL